MNPNWRMICVPRELAERLERLAIENDRLHQEGRIRLPNEYASRYPVHFVISQALDRDDAHRARGRRGKKGGKNLQT